MNKDDYLQGYKDAFINLSDVLTKGHNHFLKEVLTRKMVHFSDLLKDTYEDYNDEQCKALLGVLDEKLKELEKELENERP